MQDKKLDLIDIIEMSGLSKERLHVYADILPLYAAILQRTGKEDDALHACSRYLQARKELYQQKYGARKTT
jgi:hypothetical protein